MTDLSTFDSVESEMLGFTLRENYLSRSYTNHFSNHVNSLFLCESDVSSNPDNLITEDFKFSKKRYFEAETSILEKLDDISVDAETALSNLEDKIYEKIERQLGQFYDNSEEVGLIIDNTVHTAVLSARFGLFKRHDQYLNPWADCANILKYENYLFKPIYDSAEFSEIKKLKKGSNKSEVLDGSDIYVAVKARSENLTFGSFKDFVRLRRIMFDLIEEKVGSSNSPVNFDVLFTEFNKMNLGLSESEVKSKLIYPLKSISKIGSCREGYFMLNTCEDIAKSYQSHFSRMTGYMRTLEAHRIAASRIDNSCSYDFEKHINLNY